MVKSFIICNVVKFKEEGFFKPNQMNIFEEDSTTVEDLVLRPQEKLPPETGEIQFEITPTGNTFLKDYKEYICKFDMKKNKTGKVYGIIFHSYLEPSEFKLYYNESESLCLIQTKTDVALSFIKELNRTKLFDLAPLKINFNHIRSRVDDISGAWIAGLKGKHLNSAGLFGYNVDKSPEYQDATSKGNISLIIIKYENPIDHLEHSIGISQKGSVILYSTLDKFHDEMEFVYKIYLDLLK